MVSELVFEKWFDVKKTVVFDLDGTIYNEWEYLSAAYQAIGDDLEIQFGKSRSDIYNFLKDEFLTHGRNGLFNRLLHAFNLSDRYLSEALSILRTVKVTEKITCYRDMIRCMEWLIKHEKQIFIVTNGNVIQQKNKIGSIAFGDLLAHTKVIYANEIAPKPDPKIIFDIQNKYSFSPEEMVMIGDSDIDKSFASAAGIDFIHVSKIVKSP